MIYHNDDNLIRFYHKQNQVALLTTELHLSHNSITLTNNTTMDQSLVRLTLL